MPSKRPILHLISCASVLALAVAAGAPVGAWAAAADALGQGFANPPEAARPRVWWHWMNGNITKEGIKLDFEWMKRAGIAGVQNFDANLGTPQVVDRRLIFMTPEWKDAFRYAVDLADKLDLEMAIAASPGWSETGGPWVTPQQAMKKVVWSSTVVDANGAGAVKLSQPPATSGPFQNILVNIPVDGDAAAPFYVDTKVLAYRLPADAAQADAPVAVTSSAGPIDAASLVDGDIAKTIKLPYGAEQTRAWIRFDYAQPRTVRSATVGMPGARGFGAPPAPDAWLEASDDGVTFRRVGEMPAAAALERTATFPAVTAKSFRVVFQSRPGPRLGEAVGAPGTIARVFPPIQQVYEVSELVLHGEARVRSFEEKAGFAAAPDYYAIATPTVPATSAVRAQEVVDLTGRMRPDGTLDWKPTEGRWAVLRLGYSLTGHRNGPASPEATGLEADKLNAAHIKSYLNHYLDLYDDAAGPGMLGKRGLRALLTDSIESGPQNWTEDMLGEFQRRRGYDPAAWLPTLTGVIVDSAEASDRFLYDWRKTIAELVSESHYKVVSEIAHERGLKLYGEALESRRPQLGDDMAMRRYADIPMAAMWTYPRGSKADPTYFADIRGASSVAHIYGQNLTAAESMTSSGWPWAFSPRDLKPTADLELALGVNRFVIHTSVHQPLVDKKPGLALHVDLGQYFNRNETWAEQADAWVNYLSRSSFLLQQGQFVADVAYFYGEEAPITSLFGDDLPKDTPTGRGFDFVNTDVLQHRLEVDGGWLKTGTGMRYRVLYLGGSSRQMSLPVLQRVAALAEAGAVVVGEKPQGTPTRSDDAAAFLALADKLWAGASAADGRSVGKGRILSGRTVDQALDQLGLLKDAEVRGAPDSEIMVQHRRLDDGDLYYLSNRKDRAEQLEMAFRVNGKEAELWRPETGARERISWRVENGRTVVPLALNAGEAVFVVFRTPTQAQSYAAPKVVERPLQELSGPWTVEFQPGRGAPASTTLAKLEPWNTNADPGVRYFSGIGTYKRTIQVDQAWTADAGRVELDLGDVRDLAEVWLNGRKLGVVWHAPYRIDLSPALKPGANQLEVKVANLWVNRLIGDAQPGAAKITFTQGPAYSADAPLRPSGLLGPVRLVGVRQN